MLDSMTTARPSQTQRPGLIGLFSNKRQIIIYSMPAGMRSAFRSDFEVVMYGCLPTSHMVRYIRLDFCLGNPRRYYIRLTWRIYMITEKDVLLRCSRSQSGCTSSANWLRQRKVETCPEAQQTCDHHTEAGSLSISFEIRSDIQPNGARKLIDWHLRLCTVDESCRNLQ